MPPSIVVPEPLFVGKVRDTYAGESENTLIVVASDRISTYDVVMPQPIPGKGQVLTHMSAHWLTETPVADVLPNHFITTNSGAMPQWVDADGEMESRVTLVRRLDMLPIEAIVRGYITGSGWKDYRATGMVSGIKLPEGMLEMDSFPEPIFTPSTKATDGHDENIDFETMVKLLGGDRALAERVRDKSIEIYTLGAEYAMERGIILVDTKLEFGLDSVTGELTLGDEVLTPDSSRWVKAEDYAPGQPPISMDKQYVRDWAASTGWNKRPPAPDMPQGVIYGTIVRYGEASLRLTGFSPISA